MEELKKINRIIDKEYPEAYRETLLVLDGTTGQNALSQAKQFMEYAESFHFLLCSFYIFFLSVVALVSQEKLLQCVMTCECLPAHHLLEKFCNNFFFIRNLLNSAG